MSRMPIGDLLWFHARHKGSSLAFHQEDEDATWLQLAEGAGRKARALRDLGVGKNDVVSIGLPNGAAFIEAAFAAWTVGASVSPFSTKLPGPALRSLLDIAKPKVIIGGDALDISGWTTLPADWEPTGDGGPLASEVADHWKVMGSGGSTGTPKLIVDGRPAEWDPASHPLSDGDEVLMAAGGVYLSNGPFHHNAPFTFVFPGLFTGSEVVGMTRFDPEEVLRLIHKWRVEYTWMVPTMMARISALPEEVRAQYDLSTLKIHIHGAAPCPAWLKRMWIDWLGPRTIWEVYGSTETPGITWINGEEWLERPGSVGQFKVGSEGKIFDENGDELPPNQTGEIFMRPAAGAGSTYRYIAAQPQRRGDWETVGDLGWMDEEGYLFLADRRADLIIRAGSNVYPAEVEAAISAHPQVASCAVIGLPDDDLGAKVHAIVQMEQGSEPISTAALDAFVRQQLISYKVPSTWEFVDTPLRNEAGKVNRRELRDARVPIASRAEPVGSGGGS